VRVLASIGNVHSSDHQRKLVERRGKGQSGACIHSEFVVPSPQVLDEGMPSDHDTRGSVAFEAFHRAKSCLEATMISFDSIVGVLRGVVECSRQEIRDHADQGVGPVGGLGWQTMGGDCRTEELRGSLEVSPFGHENVDDLPVLVNGPIDVSPGPGDIQIGLVDKPVSTNPVATWLGRVDE